MRLVLGQSLCSLGGEPWERGSAAERLRLWLGCDDYADFAERFVGFNVYPYRNGRVQTSEHKEVLDKLLDEASLVVLAGKVAQEYVMHGAPGMPLWHFDKYIGVPHPSGLNRVLNTLPNEVVNEYVQSILHREEVCSSAFMR